MQRTWTGVFLGGVTGLLCSSTTKLKSAILAALVSDDTIWHLEELLSLRSPGSHTESLGLRNLGSVANQDVTCSTWVPVEAERA